MDSGLDESDWTGVFYRAKAAAKGRKINRTAIPK